MARGSSPVAVQLRRPSSMAAALLTRVVNWRKRRIWTGGSEDGLTQSFFESPQSCRAESEQKQNTLRMFGIETPHFVAAMPSMKTPCEVRKGKDWLPGMH